MADEQELLVVDRNGWRIVHQGKSFGPFGSEKLLPIAVPLTATPRRNAWRFSLIMYSSLSESKKERRVDPQGDDVRFAKSMGVSFGD